MERQDLEKRMHDGRLYRCTDNPWYAEQLARCDAVERYNRLMPSQLAERAAMLAEMFAEVGVDCVIEAPFHANWGGKHLCLGDRVYANFGLTLVDDTEIAVGDDTMIGPNVTIVTGTHPVSPRLRAMQAQYNKPVRIGRRVWIGAGCLIMPGVTIGDGSVIGAGSVVTRDVPAGVVAFGTPCRVARQITEEDDRAYDGGRPVDLP